MKNYPAENCTGASQWEERANIGEPRPTCLWLANTYFHLFISSEQTVHQNFLIRLSTFKFPEGAQTLTQQGCEHHEEAGGEIHVNRLDVGYFGKRWVGWGDEGGHGEDSGNPQSYSCWSGSSVEPEGYPGDDHDQRGGNVDLDEVVSHWPHELDLTGKTGVVAWWRIDLVTQTDIPGPPPVERLASIVFCLWPRTLNCGRETSPDTWTELSPSFHLYLMSAIVYPTININHGQESRVNSFSS